MSPLVRLSGLKVHYPSAHGVIKAVDGVDLEVRRGETVALVGESGCGKSTLARALMGIEPLAAGQIELMGRRLRGSEAEGEAVLSRRWLASQIQMVFQDPDASLNPRMTAASAILEPLKIHAQRAKHTWPARVEELLAQVGLHSSHGARYPHELSGGQKQRVSIARALAAEPQVLVLDEAVSALDVSIRSQILNLLRDLKAQLNIAYLLITHDLGVARHVADRIYVMYLGQVVELGAAESVLKAPANPYTEALVSAVPRLDPTHRAARIELKGEVPSPLNPPAGCRFHPRCPKVFDRCSREAPPLFSIGARQSRCFLAESGNSGDP